MKAVLINIELSALISVAGVSDEQVHCNSMIRIAMCKIRVNDYSGELVGNLYINSGR